MTSTVSNCLSKNVTSNIAYGNIVTTIKSVKHNVPLDDKIFAPRKAN